MNASDKISNSLVRDGISQLQRRMEALSADKVQVDERSTAQLLGFLYRYARYVLYYDDTLYSPYQKADLTLTSQGDWQDFFRRNPPFQYAAVQQFDIAGFDAAYRQAKEEISHQLPEDQFWSMFNRVMDMVMQLNSWDAQLDETTGLKGVLTALVQSDFSKALHRLIAMANTYGNRPDEVVNNIAMLQRNSDWQLSMDKLIAKDAYLQRLNNYPRRKKVKVLAQLDDLFGIFYKGIQQVQEFALKDFDTVLKGQQKHQPHVGLLYAFLQLFGQVKAQMNTIARQHLNFFYEQVLQLKKRPLSPDHVHIVTELAKQLPDYLLKKDTGLKAGKDSTGKEVTFYTEEDIVLNKAKVSQLRTLFKDDKANIYIAPVANSADGLGEGFRNPAYNSWPVLGAASYQSKNSGIATHYPFGATGLLLASPILLLKEGKRIVTASITLSNVPKQQQLAALLAKPFYLLNDAVLTAFEKGGIAKSDVTAIRDKMSAAGITEIWLDDTPGETNFVVYTGLNSTAAKNIALRKLLQVDATTEKGWYPAPLPVITLLNNQLDITFTLEADAPALVAPTPDTIGASYPVKDPVLRILFNHSLHYHLAEKEEPWYDVMSNLTIMNTTVKVDVKNVKNLLLGNDEGPLDPNNKFVPFTGTPGKDSNFYIGSDEVFRKKLKTLKVKMEWEGLPDRFETHYRAYNAGITDTSFTVGLQMLVNGQWTGSNNDLATAVPLFDVVGTIQSKREITVSNAGNIPVLTQAAVLQPYSNASLYGFIRLKLDRSFLHDQYATVLAKQMIRISELKLTELQSKAANYVSHAGTTKGQTANTLTKANNINSASPANDFTILRGAASSADAWAQVNVNDANSFKNYVSGTNTDVIDYPPPPYTPTIKSFSVDYEAEATGAEITLLHKYPYEEGNYKPLSSGAAAYFMPVYKDEGTLYIGLEQAVPGTNIALLFQLSEFTANPDIRKASIRWQYLAGNEWKALEPNTQVLSDTTQDLLVSGIVTIALPWDADDKHTILPQGYHWLKVSTEHYSAAVCEAVAVVAQAARAVFRNQENDPGRVVPGLAPQTISGLVVPDAMISKLAQPYPSFGGRREETADEFYVRVSERLRHKGRAINVFDYERIILDAFPEIFKIKCIPHTKMCRDVKGEITQLESPGWVTLAVIPRIDDFPADEKFSPRVSRIILERVSNYLRTRTSVFANVQVINPTYQPVSFSGNIRFREGLDVNYYRKKVKKEVQEYLSPWVNSGSQDIVFGGTLMMSSVLQFIEQRDYVDYVTDFNMFVKRDGSNGPPVKAVTADTPWSVLIAGEQSYESINSCTGTVQVPVFKIK
ncbi:baseplate J/gp47 family protein [Chitinophaga tropicalis]|uniref:Baseplate protein J-like domain-containing protein n=1 Tax=Chitinophaga tropicalis TaxID=2683588 RepID=A0A7K1U1V4_9BACT|nr:baseplate J/gp47 family protein [Chitinophaga tropicalis]MVT08323.1 hypothetical protein [Chitinophaga tropicalis]